MTSNRVATSWGSPLPWDCPAVRPILALAELDLGEACAVKWDVWQDALRDCLDLVAGREEQMPPRRATPTSAETPGTLGLVAAAVGRAHAKEIERLDTLLAAERARLRACKRERDHAKEAARKETTSMLLDAAERISGAWSAEDAQELLRTMARGGCDDERLEDTAKIMDRRFEQSTRNAALRERDEARKDLADLGKLHADLEDSAQEVERHLRLAVETGARVTVERDEARNLCASLVASVRLDDSRLSYVTVQVERDDLDAARRMAEEAK